LWLATALLSRVEMLIQKQLKLSKKVVKIIRQLLLAALLTHAENLFIARRYVVVHSGSGFRMNFEGFKVICCYNMEFCVCKKNMNELLWVRR
jgi:hypothetical protein